MIDDWIEISITLEDGRVVSGHYRRDGGIVTVSTFGGSKAIQVGGSPPEDTARRLLEDLAREGKGLPSSGGSKK